MAALNSATSSNAIDPNAEDNCDDAETGNAQESNGYEELPELQAVVIDRALHDELTAAIAYPGPLPTIYRAGQLSRPVVCLACTRAPRE